MPAAESPLGSLLQGLGYFNSRVYTNLNHTTPTPTQPGVATALKVLFSQPGCDGSDLATEQLPFGEELQLERNEVIALINLLGRFSQSLHSYRELSALLDATRHGNAGNSS